MVVGLTALAAVVMIGSRVMGLGAGVPRSLFDYQHFVYELPASRTLGPWAYRAPLLAAHTWAAVVLARKGWRAPDAWPSARGAGRPAKLWTGARLLAVVFVLGAVTPVIQAAEYGGAVPHGVSNTFNLLLLALSVIIYTTHAPRTDRPAVPADGGLDQRRGGRAHARRPAPASSRERPGRSGVS